MQTYTLPGVVALTESHQKEVILVWNEPEDGHLFWTFTVTEKEFKLFEQEIIQYNKWIDEYLLEGFAPLCSYRQDESDEPDQIVFAQSQEYQEIFGRPGGRVYYELREHGGFSFDLIYVDGPMEDDLREEITTEILREYDVGRLPIEPIQTLHDLITDPCSLAEEFALGYRILPMTQRLMDRAI